MQVTSAEVSSILNEVPEAANRGQESHGNAHLCCYGRLVRQTQRQAIREEIKFSLGGIITRKFNVNVERHIVHRF